MEPFYVGNRSTAVHFEGPPSTTSAQVRLGLLCSRKELQDKYQCEAELQFTKKKI